MNLSFGSEKNHKNAGAVSTIVVVKTNRTVVALHEH